MAVAQPALTILGVVVMAVIIFRIIQSRKQNLKSQVTDPVVRHHSKELQGFTGGTACCPTCGASKLLSSVEKASYVFICEKCGTQLDLSEESYPA